MLNFHHTTLAIPSKRNDNIVIGSQVNLEVPQELLNTLAILSGKEEEKNAVNELPLSDYT
jgi:hypothetical protein